MNGLISIPLKERHTRFFEFKSAIQGRKTNGEVAAAGQKLNDLAAKK
jgi:hypothetical protein